MSTGRDRYLCSDGAGASSGASSVQPFHEGMIPDVRVGSVAVSAASQMHSGPCSPAPAAEPQAAYVPAPPKTIPIRGYRRCVTTLFGNGILNFEALK